MSLTLTAIAAIWDPQLLDRQVRGKDGEMVPNAKISVFKAEILLSDSQPCPAVFALWDAESANLEIGSPHLITAKVYPYRADIEGLPSDTKDHTPVLAGDLLTVSPYPLSPSDSFPPPILYGTGTGFPLPHNNRAFSISATIYTMLRGGNVPSKLRLSFPEKDGRFAKTTPPSSTGATVSVIALPTAPSDEDDVLFDAVVVDYAHLSRASGTATTTNTIAAPSTPSRYDWKHRKVIGTGSSPLKEDPSPAKQSTHKRAAASTPPLSPRKKARTKVITPTPASKRKGKEKVMEVTDESDHVTEVDTENEQENESTQATASSSRVTRGRK